MNYGRPNGYPKRNANPHTFILLLVQPTTSVVPMEGGVRIGNLLPKALTLSSEVSVDAEEGNAKWEFQKYLKIGSSIFSKRLMTFSWCAITASERERRQKPARSIHY